MAEKTFKYMTLLSMFYIGLSLTSSCLVHKFIYIGGHFICAGSFTMPLWFVLSDIITEVYGYNQSRKLLWSLVIVELFLYSILQLFAMIQPHTPPSGAPYQFVFGSMIRIYFAIWVSLFLSNFINTYIIAKLKITLRRRHFWARSILASSIGEILYTTIGFYGILGGTIDEKTLWWLIGWGCFLKITISILLALPASLATYALKKVENSDPYDLDVNFSPFKFQV